MARVSRPQNPHIQQADKKLEIGAVGLLFGDAKEKPGNIAGFAIILSFVGLLAVLIFVPDGAQVPKREVVTLFAGIITTALGFLFGRSRN